jgi:hypothetical protein
LDGKVLYRNGISNNGYLRFSQISGSPDGGFIAVSNGSPSTVVKFNSSGSVLWTKADRFGFGYPFSQRTTNNGFVLAKRARSGAEVIRYDDAGTKIWQQKVRVKKFELQSLGRTLDNGVILAGKCSDCNELRLIALNEKGEPHWNGRYALDIGEFAVSQVIPTTDSGYAVTGGITSKTGKPRSGFLLKIDSKGNVAFAKTFGSPDQDASRSIFATADDGYVLFGSSGRNDSLFLNLDSDGKLSRCNFLQPINALALGPVHVSLDVVKAKSSKSPQVSQFQFNVHTSSSKAELVSVCP